MIFLTNNMAKRTVSYKRPKSISIRRAGRMKLPKLTMFNRGRLRKMPKPRISKVKFVFRTGGKSIHS
jgi:hypothetical protein